MRRDTTSTLRPVLAIDPGSDKCGLAIVASDGGVLARRIVAPQEIETHLRELLQAHCVAQIVLGNATTSRALRERLSTQFPQVLLSEVEERNSTLEARDLYWQANPPRGWRRVLPLSLQVPPVAIDDFAAVVLARRFLSQSEQ